MKLSAIVLCMGSRLDRKNKSDLPEAIVSDLPGVSSATKLILREHQCITRMCQGMKKTIITVVGRDTVGIIAKVCTYLAENQVNVEDISQTIVQGYFNMMMIVDTGRSTKPFGEMVNELEALGDEIGVRIRCQREDIFTKMHRI